MDAVTAVKIQMVNESPFNDSKPRTVNASEIKNAIKKGPEPAIFPVKIYTRDIIRNKTANASAAK
jgi:hypothetical protein